jgi:ABC transport system ATP-binding/permease protein
LFFAHIAKWTHDIRPNFNYHGAKLVILSLIERLGFGRIFVLMNFLSVDQVSKTWHDKAVLDKVTFGIQQGEKVALVAGNGQGKTTLFSIIVGKETPDEGKAIIRKDIKYAYLSQDTDIQDDLTVLENILLDDLEVTRALTRYNHVLEQLELHPESDELMQQLAQVNEVMNALNAWDYEARVKQVLGKLKIDRLNQKGATLSGGQKKRVALAKVILSGADFLLLDEPTNHLDLDMIEWLEQFLLQRDLTLLLITHDRYFLDRVCDRIIEIDRGALFHYQGNFSYFIENKALREAQLQSELEKDRNLYRKELEWVRRMPKARTTKSKSRTEAFEQLEAKLKGQRAKLEVRMDVRTERMGSKVLELHRVSKSYDTLKILDAFSYHFKRGEKVGIIGPNGIGKSTLLNIIMGLDTPDSGKIVHGETLNIGYYSQQGIQVDESKKVIDVVRDIADWIPLSNGNKLTASQLLLQFGFSYDKQHDFVVKLSGGERRRLYLLTVLMAAPNFLILDEPTNDLDIETLAVLEDFLQAYQGCLLVVSHDRFFMDRLVEHCFIFKGEGVVQDFPGNYSDYRDFLEYQTELESIVSKVIKRSDTNPSDASNVKEQHSSTLAAKRKLSFKEQFEFEQIEKELPVLMHKKSSLEEELSSLTSQFDRIVELSKELEDITSKIDTMELRWLELSV